MSGRGLSKEQMASWTSASMVQRLCHWEKIQHSRSILPAPADSSPPSPGQVLRCILMFSSVQKSRKQQIVRRSAPTFHSIPSRNTLCSHTTALLVIYSHLILLKWVEGPKVVPISWGGYRFSLVSGVETRFRLRFGLCRRLRSWLLCPNLPLLKSFRRPLHKAHKGLTSVRDTP